MTITKTHQGRTSVTFVAMTRRGRIAFGDYTAALHALLAGNGAPPAEPLSP